MMFNAEYASSAQLFVLEKVVKPIRQREHPVYIFCQAFHRLKSVSKFVILHSKYFNSYHSSLTIMSSGSGRHSKSSAPPSMPVSPISPGLLPACSSFCPFSNIFGMLYRLVLPSCFLCG